MSVDPPFLEEAELEALFSSAPLPRGYTLTGLSTVCQTKTRSSGLRDIVLGDPLAFVAVFDYPDGTVRLGIAFMRQSGKLAMVTIAGRDLVSSAAMSALLDAGWVPQGTVGLRKRLEEMHASVIHELPRFNVVKQNGMQASKKTFIMDSQRYGEDAGSVLLESSRFLGLTARGTLQEWQANVAMLVENEPLLAASVCMPFAAAIKGSVLQQGAVVNLLGRTSTGKTTAVKVATSAYTDPKTGVNTWAATEPALDELIESHSGFLLPIDEIKSGRNPKSDDALLHRFGAQRTKRKAKGYGGGVLTETLALSTQEISHFVRRGDLADGGGAVRFLDIPIGTGIGGVFRSVDNTIDAAALAKRLSHNSYIYFGTAMPAFVQALLQRDWVPEAQALFHSIQALYADPEHDALTMRGMDVFACFAAAGILAVRFGVLPWSEETVTNSCRVMFDCWRNRQESARSASPASDVAQRLAMLMKTDDVISRIIQAVGTDIPTLSELRLKQVEVRPDDPTCPAFRYKHDGVEVVCLGEARFGAIVGNAKPTLIALKHANKLRLNSHGGGYKLSVETGSGVRQFVALMMTSVSN